MTLDLDTFLVALYYHVDDLFQRLFAPHKPRGLGRPELVSDSEVLTLALLEQWHKRRSETDFLVFVASHWSAYFPRLLTQSAFNKRVRALTGVLCLLGPALALRLAELDRSASSYQVTDGLPLPLMRLCRGKRRRLFTDEADLGYDHLDGVSYYGVKLFAAVNAGGAVTGFVVGPASTEEHFLAEALFRWRVFPEQGAPTAEELREVLGKTHKKGGQRRGPNGRISGLGAGKAFEGPVVSDLGLRGKKWQAHWREDYGAKVLTQEAYQGLPKEERKRERKWLSGLRQKVETSFDWLVEELGARLPKARSYVGLLARLGAKVAALNAMLLINLSLGRPRYTFFDPLYAA